jgi:hypothetical protein
MPATCSHPAGPAISIIPPLIAAFTIPARHGERRYARRFKRSRSTQPAVHIQTESVFTLRWNPRPPSAGICSYDFERFMFISRVVKKGHCLRLVIGPINSIYSQKNYNSGGVVSEESMQDARIVTVKLFHDESHPTTLYVPIGQPES